MVELLDNPLEAGIGLQVSNLLVNSAGLEARGILVKSPTRSPPDTQECSAGSSEAELSMKERCRGEARLLTHSSVSAVRGVHLWHSMQSLASTGLQLC